MFLARGDELVPEPTAEKAVRKRGEEGWRHATIRRGKTTATVGFLVSRRETSAPCEFFLEVDVSFFRPLRNPSPTFSRRTFVEGVLRCSFAKANRDRSSCVVSSDEGGTYPKTLGVGVVNAVESYISNRVARSSYISIT